MTTIIVVMLVVFYLMGAFGACAGLLYVEGSKHPSMTDFWLSVFWPATAVAGLIIIGDAIEKEKPRF